MKTRNLLKMGMGLVLAVALMAGPGFAAGTVSDSQIESSAKESYAFRHYLQDEPIQIHSVEGVVTLSGTVAKESDKALAEQTVQNLPGVKRVNNELKVTAEQAPARSDAWVAFKVKTALLFHQSVSGTGTSVEVKDGVAILTGEAENKAQMDLTTKYAEDVEGVKEVLNRMTLAPQSQSSDKDVELDIKEKAGTVEKKVEREADTIAEKIDNASITAMVKVTLMYHRSTSGLKTKVTTRDGVVILSGEAQTEAEKDLATEYAKDVEGVREVINKMTVKSPS